jgi:cytochrome P450
MAPLPPGPDDGVLAQTVRLHRDPLGRLRAWQALFGDVFTIRLATARPVVVVASPSAVQDLLESDPAWAHAGEARRQILPMASPRSAFGGDGEAHRGARGRIAAALRPEILDARRASMERLAEKHAEGWPRALPVRLMARVRALVDDVFVRLVLGIEDEARAQAAAAGLRRALATPGNPPFTLPGEGDGLAGAVATKVFERRVAPLRATLAEEVQARRRDGGDRDDLVGALVDAEPALSAEAIADELIVVLAAAQEPPAIALTRLLLQGAPPEQAVIRETLRLWPAALAALRRLTEPRVVAGRELPAGVDVMVPSPLLHRDARSFPDPDAFRPERWETRAADEAAYLPFGGGARRCVGEPLAHLYFATLLPAIARRVRVRRVLPAERMVLRGTVLVPRNGGLALVSRR